MRTLRGSNEADEFRNYVVLISKKDPDKIPESDINNVTSTVIEACRMLKSIVPMKYLGDHDTSPNRFVLVIEYILRHGLVFAGPNKTDQIENMPSVRLDIGELGSIVNTKRSHIQTLKDNAKIHLQKLGDELKKNKEKDSKVKKSGMKISALSTRVLKAVGKSTASSKKAKRLVKQIQEQQAKNVKVARGKADQNNSSRKTKKDVNQPLRQKQQNVYMALQKEQGIERLAMHLLSHINDYSTCEEHAINLFQKITQKILQTVNNLTQFQAVSKEMEKMLPFYEGSCLWISVSLTENGLQLAEMKSEVEQWAKTDGKKKTRNATEKIQEEGLDRELVDKIIHFLRADTKEFFDVLLNVLDHAIQLKYEEIDGSTNGSQQICTKPFNMPHSSSKESQNKSGVKRRRDYTEAGTRSLERSSLDEGLHHSTISNPPSSHCDGITNTERSYYEDPLPKRVLGTDLVESTTEVAYIAKENLHEWMSKVLDESIISAQVEIGQDKNIEVAGVNRDEALRLAADSVMKNVSIMTSSSN